MFRRCLVALLLAVMSKAGSSQSGPTTLNNESLIKMHEAGMGDDLLVTAISTGGGSYDTTTDGLIALKKGGIDDRVIEAMLLHTNAAVSYPSAPAVSKDANAPALSGLRRPRIFLTPTRAGRGLLALRNQDMEMSKDLERECPSIQVTVKRQAADYTLSLNHMVAGSSTTMNFSWQTVMAISSLRRSKEARRSLRVWNASALSF